MEIVQRVLGFLLILILPIAAIIFAYVGFLFLTSGGSTETKTKAKGVLVKVLIGIVLVLAAWLIVKTIVTSLELDPEASLLDNTPL
jgi:Co/Zn/Cd efflux system component